MTVAKFRRRRNICAPQSFEPQRPANVPRDSKTARRSVETSRFARLRRWRGSGPPGVTVSHVGVLGLVVAAAGLCTLAIDSLVGLCVVIAGLTTTATDSIIVALHDRKSGTN